MTNDILVRPEPWIGDAFVKERLALRTLIVGDSHYGDERSANDPEFTRTIVKSRCNDLHHGQFFGVIEQIIIGRKLLIAEVRDFWSTKCFINYAPTMVLNGISSSPAHFVGAQKRLRDLVVELDIDLVCFFSAAAWALRPWGEPSWDEEVFGYEPRNYSDSITIYPRKGRSMVMVRFNHPRALGAPMDVWHNWYNKAVSVAFDAVNNRI